jgi:signal transduction histidine kinase
MERVTTAQAVSDKVYSNKLIIGYIKQLDECVTASETDRILESIGLDRHRIMDQTGFVNLEENDAVFQAVAKATGIQDLGYVTGRNIANSIGRLGGFLVGLTSPAFAMKSLGEIEGRLALKTVNRTRKLGGNRFRVDITFKDGFKEKQYVCRNRIGCYEALPLFFGLPYSQVEHPECAFEGHDHCVYFIQFPEYGFNVFNRIFQASVISALVLAGIWLTDTQKIWTLIASLVFAAAGSISFAIFRNFNAKKSMEWSLITNEGLTRQKKTLETTNDQIHSLQEITTQLNNCIHVQDICEKVVDALVSKFRFGSSQIWLLDEQKEFLSCRSALGYTSELTAFIRNTRFKMGENWDNPYGLLVQTLEQKKTLLVNDPEEVYARVTPRTREFLKALNISSFIITPLIHEGKAIGILAAEYHHGEKLQNQDKLLFQSVSNSIANALMTAALIESMERKIEQRTRDLEAVNRQLLTAKEMAIQSEKLSSLGQMAAGVAHEINNPLNFLVNIIPDVRRDLEGLEKIRDLAIKAGLNGELSGKISQVDEEYDLPSHLEEKNFVFEKIQKALDKSTRIANSLKVFSRSSAKEIVTLESLAGMVRDVIELVPQKVRGDTLIEVGIPDGLSWNVNKNEMEQAFLVLINNAIDAMGQKGRLGIAAKESIEEIMLSFKDEGPGIPESVIKRIFDPFYTTKPPGKGTGLGLTIASEIVKKYGGTLGVESVPGSGATFSIRFRK